jgi:hypothetical protein
MTMNMKGRAGWLGEVDGWMDELINGWTVFCDQLGSEPEIRYPYLRHSSTNHPNFLLLI